MTSIRYYYFSALSAGRLSLLLQRNPLLYRTGPALCKTEKYSLQ